MTNNIYEMIYSAKNILLVFLILQISVSIGQVKEMSLIDTSKSEVNNQKLILKQSTTFPQIHTNLDGLVREFVRTMYQDRNGNYWFGTNGDGIIRYDGRTLEKITIAGLLPNFRVFEIVEDREGNIWFGTSEGLLKNDGLKFETFLLKEGLMHVNAEI
jgi:ligand-binding sensor domain-containing protein